ncbi:hypothetical protein ACQJBY_044483 [Aegilops geniculata]
MPAAVFALFLPSPPRKTDRPSEGGAPWPVLTSSVQIQLQLQQSITPSTSRLKKRTRGAAAALCSYENALLQDRGGDAHRGAGLRLRRGGRQPLPCKQRAKRCKTKQPFSVVCTEFGLHKC